MAQVTKKDPVKHTINISVREFRYKSVLQLSEENYSKVETGGSVLLRMRERPTHIGMSFVSAVPPKNPIFETPAETPVLTFGNAPEVSAATLAKTARQVYSNRQSLAAGLPIPGFGSGISTSVASTVFAGAPMRMFSSTRILYADSKSGKLNVPPGMRIAVAQRGVTTDDFSDSAAPFEPYMFDLDPEDLLPRPPRVPVPPKPSRALKSRSRSMILNPIRREEDSTPLPEGSPTHIAIPAAVARAQAAAAAKAAAKEAKEAAKAAAKAAGTKETKTRKKATTETPATGDAAANAGAATTDAASTAASASAAPSANPIPASSTAAPHAVGPLGTTTSSTSTTVGPAPTPNTPARSFSIFARSSATRAPLSVSLPTFDTTSVRTYAGRKKTPFDDVPEPKSDAPTSPATTGGQSQKGKSAPPVANDDEDDENVIEDEDDDEGAQDDEDEDENENEDENEDEDEDKDLEEKDLEEKEGDEDEDEDEKDEDEKDDEDDDEDKDDGDDDNKDDEFEGNELEENNFDEDEKFGDKEGDEDEDDDMKDFGDDDEDEPPKKGGKAGFSVSEAAIPLAGAAAGVGAMAAASAAAARAGQAAPAPPAPPASTRGKPTSAPAKPAPAAAKPAPAPVAPAPTGRGRGRGKAAEKPVTVGNDFQEGAAAKKPAAKRGPKK